MQSNDAPAAPFRVDAGKSRIAVASRSFSRSPLLRQEMQKRYANVTFNDAGEQFEGERLIGFLRGHDAAIIALEKITAQVLDALPELRGIAKYGVGLDNLDLAALDQRGVLLGWQGGVNRRAVSELVIGQAITLLRKLHTSWDEIRAGQWRQIQGAQITGKTVGIVGLGHVGKDLTRLLQAFGCRVIAHDIRAYPEFCAQTGVEMTDLATLLAQSDIVSLHVPHDRSTRGMIGAEQLRLMKPTAILINAARGGIIDEDALAEALAAEVIAGAALDVFDVEPPTHTRLFSLPNIICSGHMGGSSREAVEAMGLAAIDGLEAFRPALSHLPPAP